MKIYVEVDLKDMFSVDDELSFSEQIKNEIVSLVKNRLLEENKKSIDEMFYRLMSNEFKKEKEEYVSNVIRDTLKGRKFKRHSYDKEELTLEEHIEKEFRKKLGLMLREKALHMKDRL